MITEPRVVLTGAVPTKALLWVSDRDYIRPPLPFPLTRRLLGKSILAASGEDWQRQHRLLYKALLDEEPPRLFLDDARRNGAHVPDH